MIAIIGVLAGLLFPSISKIQEKGRVAACVSNLKQLHAGAMNYVSGEGKGHLPRTASAEVHKIRLEIDPYSGQKSCNYEHYFVRGWVDWWPVWDDDEGTQTPDPPSTSERQTHWWNDSNGSGLASITNGALFRYVGDLGDERIYVCPSMRRRAKSLFKGDGTNRDKVARSYGMNASVNNARYNELDDLSRRIMFADQGLERQEGYRYALGDSDENLNWQDTELPTSDPALTKVGEESYWIRRSYRNFDGSIDWRGAVDNKPDEGQNKKYEHIGEYHDGRGNVVFCDGHVERIRYQGTSYICSGNWEDGRFYKVADEAWHNKSELANE